MKALEDRLDDINKNYKLVCDMEYWVNEFVNSIILPKEKITLTNVGEQVCMYYTCEDDVPLQIVLADIRKVLGTNYKKGKVHASHFISYIFTKVVNSSVVIFIVYEKVKF